MREIEISRAIVEAYFNDLLQNLQLDIAIVGAGPSGMVAGYYLAKGGAKVAIFEKKLSVGGGIWGGAMGFNRVVVQESARRSSTNLGWTTARLETASTFSTR